MKIPSLRPCPFCGGDEIEISSEDGVTKAFYRAYCEVCSSVGSFARSRAAAIRAWNARHGNTINEQIGCLVDIRRVVGDPEGKLMQDELVEKIAGLVDDAALGRAVRAMPEYCDLYRLKNTWEVSRQFGGPRGFGETPEDALRRARLMKEAEK